jgi:hypothetical protein
MTFYITADIGYQIKDVKVDKISIGAVSTYIFDNITDNHTISATFSQIIIIHTISASADAGGSINPIGITELNQGLNQIYNITANSRYQISDVKIDNVSMGILSSYTFNNINSDHTISVSFLPKEVRDIADNSNVDVIVYPNPFKEEFTIRIDDPVEELFNLSIVNSSGKQIDYQTKLSSKDLIIFKEPMIQGISYLKLFNREKKIVKLILRN